MMIYTAEQYARRMREQAEHGPAVTMDGHQYKAAVVACIDGVQRLQVDGKPAVVLFVTEEDGDSYGVVMDRTLANDITALHGPHPLVEEFFKLN
jgi:hypothetical protein